MTSRPGRNFRVAGLGVDSVWMNMGVRFLERFQLEPYMDLDPGRIKAAQDPPQKSEIMPFFSQSP